MTASVPPAPASPAAPARPVPAIDPALALALALRATPGAYALLVGSGLSSAAGIPTGWGVVLDLIRKIAPPGTAEAPGGLEGWYRATYGEEPDYAKLLAAVAGTPGERRDLLRGYFEPTAEERADGRKLPTTAHRAIARLVVGGYVRVIVTTNFDQLLETALRDAGVSPTVISTPDARAGAMPLQHERVTVIKVHGDFMDVRIKNTPEELARYHRSMNGLLDRVFDEYGLVVAGWSAAWDEALRAAILRAPNRRFSMFWAQRGGLAPEAERLIAHRYGTLVPVAGADEFFGGVAETVASLEELDRAHPVSAAVAVASLKRYLPRPEERIRLHDLVMAEVEAVRGRALDLVPTEAATEPLLLAAVPRLEAATETLAALLATGAYWGAADHAALWGKALERLASVTRDQGGWTWWIRLVRYPAQLAFYAAGVAAAAAGDDAGLAALVVRPRVRTPTEGEVPVARALDHTSVIEHDAAKLLPGYERRTVPMSDRLHAVTRAALRDVVPHDDVYDAAFDRFELLVALAWSADREVADAWFPLGRVVYRQRYAFQNQGAVARMGEEIKAAGREWALLRAGLFGGDPARLAAMWQAMVAQSRRPTY